MKTSENTYPTFPVAAGCEQIPNLPTLGDCEYIRKQAGAHSTKVVVPGAANARVERIWL